MSEDSEVKLDMTFEMSVKYLKELAQKHVRRGSSEKLRRGWGIF